MSAGRTQGWRVARASLALGCLSLLGACGDDHAEILYSHDFTEGSGGWNTARTLLMADQIPAQVQDCWISWLSLTACTLDAPVVQGRMRLESPWWLDPNHAPPGAGYLSLLAWVYLDGPASSSTLGLRTLDLRGATLQFDIAAYDLDLRGGHLVFWFQTATPDGHYANFAYTSRPIEPLLPRDGSLERVKLRLSPEDKDWTCLASAVQRADFYGCMPVLDALAAVTRDFGLIIFPVSGSPLPEDQPTGVIEVQSVELARR